MSGNIDKSLVLSAFSHIGAQREHTSIIPRPYVTCLDITGVLRLGSVMLTEMLTNAFKAVCARWCGQGGRSDNRLNARYDAHTFGKSLMRLDYDLLEPTWEFGRRFGKLAL